LDYCSVPASRQFQGVSLPRKKECLSGAFFWLSAFYVVYCIRPADFFPFLGIIPLAKITGLLALVSLLISIGKTPRKFRDVPKEGRYLFAIIVLFFVSAFLSMVWKGGAFFGALEFSKSYIVWILTFLLITTLTRLKRVIFFQSASVAAISVLAIAKGHSIPRLQGVIGGLYSNPNDLAFAIVLSLPFCLAFLLTAKGGIRKLLWSFSMLMMAAALVLTASRAGFIDLVIAGFVCLWHFGVKGKRLYLIGISALLGTVLLVVAGDRLMKRFSAMAGSTATAGEEATAYESFEERKELMIRSLESIRDYPLLGVGMGNFAVYSGMWKDVHASYLQIAAEGGIPVLILYLMFFGRGFANLKMLRNKKNLDSETRLFLGALTSSLVGFVVGACFAPEAFSFFPYFTVCYTSVFVAMHNEQAAAAAVVPALVRAPRPFAQV
jgi:O-antigen ligase